MAGDSITAQHLHSNYFEAFCFARYPDLKFAFRNSGVGGHTIPSTLARFDYDIAAWHPTVVSVELGMNDQGGTPTDKFVENMKTMVGRIRAINARPVILTSSPINNGTTLQAMGPTNRLHEYAAALKEYAAKENIPFADQFHALVDVWANNKPHEGFANALPVLKQISTDDTLAGVDHLRISCGPGRNQAQRCFASWGCRPPRPDGSDHDGRRPPQGPWRRSLRQQRQHRQREA